MGEAQAREGLPRTRGDRPYRNTLKGQGYLVAPHARG